MVSSIKIVEDQFGAVPDPQDDTKSKKVPVRRFTFTNQSGTKIQIINYGATITSIKVSDRKGQVEDVVLGFEDIEGYLGAYGRNPYFGATVGRVANRIAKGKFTVDGKQYQVGVNNGENHLHGGIVGFDKKFWDVYIEDTKLTFSYLSRDGEEGYPGDVLASVTYELTEDNRLLVDYKATVTKPTPIGLTNHSYFNLSGHKNADKNLTGHYIMLNSNSYTPVDDTLITTGEIKPVKGTIFDLTANQNVNELLKKFPEGPNGYDNNFCVNFPEEGVRLVARAQEVESGRVLEVYSDQPGVQFYTSNFLPDKDPLPGKEGAKYFKHGAFCLETQNYPNAINHGNFPNAVITPGKVYTHKVIYKFFTTPTK